MQPDWMQVIESINICIYRKQKVFCLLSHVSHKFPGQWVILANQADYCPLFLCVPSCNVQPWSRPCKWSSHHVPLDTENVALNDELFFPKRNWHTAEQSSFFLSSSLFTSLEVFQGRKLFCLVAPFQLKSILINCLLLLHDLWIPGQYKYRCTRQQRIFCQKQSLP